MSVQDSINQLKVNVDATTGSFQKQDAVVSALAGKLGNLSNQEALVSANQTVASEKATKLTSSFERLQRQLDPLTRLQEQYEKRQRLINDYMQANADKADRAQAAMAKLNAEYQQSRDRLTGQTRQRAEEAQRIDEVTRSYNALNAELNPLVRAQQILAQRQKILNEALAAGKIDAATYQQQMARVTNEYEKQRIAAEKNSASQKTAWSSLGNGLSRLRDSVLSYGAAIAGATAAVTGIYRAADRVDSIAERAETMNMSTDALQRFELVAQSSGVRARELQTGLQRLTRQMADARDGNEKAKESFSRLGIDLDQLLDPTTDTEQGMLMLADALAKVEDPAMKGKRAFELLGRAGQNLLPMLNELPEKLSGVKPYFDERTIKDMGAVASSFEALGNALLALGARVVSIFSGILTTVTDTLTWMTQRFQEFFAFLDKGFQIIGDWAGPFMDKIGQNLFMPPKANGRDELLDILQRPTGRNAGEVSMAQKLDAEKKLAELDKAYQAQALQQALRPGWEKNKPKPVSEDAEKATRAIEEQIAAMEKERRMLGLAARERAIASAVETAHNAAKRENIKLTSQQVLAVQSAAAALYDARAAQEAATAAEAARMAELKRQQEEWQRVVDRTTDNIVDNLADGLLGRGGNIMQQFRAMVLESFKQIAANAIIRPIIAPIVASTLGGMAGGLAGGSAFGGAGGAGGGFGIMDALSLGNSTSSLFGGAGLGGIGGAINSAGASMGFGYGASFVGPTLPGTAALTSASLTSVLGAAGIGFALGGMIGGTGGGIGGGLGAGVGMIAGGPIGALIGGAAGTALGSLFGNKKPSNFTAGGAYDFAARRFTASEDGANDQTRAARDTFFNSAQQLVTAIEQATGQSASGKLGLAIGQRDSTKIFVGDKSFTAGVNDVGGAIAVLAQNVQGLFGQTLPDAFSKALAAGGDLQKMVENLNFASAYKALLEQKPQLSAVEQALQELTRQFDEARKKAGELGLALAPLNNAEATQRAKIAGDYVQELRDAIDGIADPNALALRQLDKWRDEQIKTANAVGAGLVEIERLYGLRRQQIAQQGVADNRGAIREWLTRQALGNSSSLGFNDRLLLAQNEFGSALTNARGGDTSGLLGAADTLLGVARDGFASSADFTRIEGFIRQSLSPFATPAAPAITLDMRPLLEVSGRGFADVVDELVQLRAELRRLSDRTEQNNLVQGVA